MKQESLFLSEKHKKVFRVLNYFELFLVFVSAVSGCVSISAFALLVNVIVGIANSPVGLKIFAITAGIKKYKTIIKKKTKKLDKIVLLGKVKLDTIKVLISKVLIVSYISHDNFFSVNSVSREYNEIKEEIKSPQDAVEYVI